MKVILLDYVYKHGVAGEVIDVADGYARNFLIPKKLAVKATAGELKRAKKLREQSVAKRAALEQRMNDLAREIDGVELFFERRAAITGKLFGSVTTQEIADALLEATGVDINRRRISQQGLREIGTHPVPIRLGNEISPEVKITIVQEGTLTEYLAKRAAAEAVDSDDEAGEDGEAIVSEDEATNMATEVLPADEMRAQVEAIQAEKEAEANAEAETSEEDSDE